MNRIFIRMIIASVAMAAMFVGIILMIAAMMGDTPEGFVSKLGMIYFFFGLVALVGVGLWVLGAKALRRLQRL